MTEWECPFSWRIDRVRSIKSLQTKQQARLLVCVRNLNTVRTTSMQPEQGPVGHPLRGHRATRDIGGPRPFTLTFLAAAVLACSPTGSEETSQLPSETEGMGTASDTMQTSTTGLSSTTTANPSSGSTNATGSSSDATTEGGDMGCDDLFATDPPTPIAIRIVNASGQDVVLDDECPQPGVDSVRIDGRRVLDPWHNFACDDLLINRCQAPDCFGGLPYILPAGETYEGTWDGRLRTDAGLLSVPDNCSTHCTSGPQTPCAPQRAATPGMHTLAVAYRMAADQPEKEASLSFEMPRTDALVITLPPV